MHSPLVASMTVFWAIWTATAAPNGGICYGLNQVQNTNFFPCDSEAETSFCCAENHICLSNGLCEPIGDQRLMHYYTSDCTDSSWNANSTCLEICNNNKTNPTKGKEVMGCPDGNYCCSVSNDSTCCSTPSLLFNLGSGPVTAQTTIPASRTSVLSTTEASLTPSSAVSSLLVSSTSSTISPSSALPPFTPSSSSTATVITPSPSAPPSNKNVAIGVGVGVGVPAGLAVLGGLAYLLRRRSNPLSTGLDNKKESYVSVDGEQGFEMASGGRVQELPEQGLVELQHQAPAPTSGFGKR